jgi:DNA invertase Pin-like site-specific DNA recombinase
MSTEHQQYSTENQALCIAQDAQSHGFTITNTYCESAKSGFGLKGRPGLRELLRDVTEGGTAYKAILGYDVRRSGRFQDTDEAAHYEFVCKSAGVPVRYRAKTFAKDGSLPSSIMKALKRAMAGEYRRELSVAVEAVASIAPEFRVVSVAGGWLRPSADAAGPPESYAADSGS